MESKSPPVPKPKILAPAGSWDALHAAIDAGADAIYFGVGPLNMRSHSALNFQLSDLEKIQTICSRKKVNPYITINSIIYNEDLPLMKDFCLAAKACQIPAVIASDLSVVQFARSIDLGVHLSTQLNICNIEAIRFYAAYADLLVLARELSLEQIQTISETIQKEQIRGPSGKLIEIELFVHGALCVSISGKCYMSLAAHHQSANRGQCMQPCRRKYRVVDDETQNELLIDNQYIMSPKDLCMIGFLDQLINAKVNVFKIEGRGRSPEYVYTVTKAYREALDAVYLGKYSPERIDAWRETLKTVYNRGFWEGGYYLGSSLGEWSGTPGSKATKKKQYIGKITNYFSKIRIAECKLESGSIKLGDQIFITGPTTGVVEGTVQSLVTEEKVEIAHAGSLVALPVEKKVRKNDKIYLLEDRMISC